MFARQKPAAPKRRNHNLAQFGLTEIPDDFDPTAGLGSDGDNDSDLEAELAALASGGGTKSKPKAKPKPDIVATSDLDKMVAASMKDVESDDEEDDVDDEELMGELKHIADDDLEENVENSTESPVQTYLPTTDMNVVAIVQKRLELYKLAESQAKEAGEAAKARRFTRALKTLADLLKKASAGEQINVDDIPPEIHVKGGNTISNASTEPTTPSSGSEEPKVARRAAPPIPVRPPTPPPNIVEADPQPEQPEVVENKNPLLEQMSQRQTEYKAAALEAKRNGQINEALQYLKVVKQFEIVMKMVSDGQEVDMSDMPPPPAEFAAFMTKMQAGGAEANSSSTTTEPAAAPEAAATTTSSTASATTVLEALEQRLDKYKSVEQAAKAEGNASKARRYTRIVKQYEDAIKQHKAGREVAYDELPIPPGFGPLPTASATAKAEATVSPASAPISPPTASTPSTDSTPISTPQPAKRVARVSPKPELTTRTSGNHQRNNLAEQQMQTLLERQKEFKVAALEAKKSGEIEQAKEYLKIYKGFDALLNAASSGLPVDLNTLPVPPSQRDGLEASFAIVDAEECDPNDDIADIGVRIEEQLAKQLMMCKNTRDHHKAMGDIAGMNRFENLALTVQKDLDLVRYTKRHNMPLPKFHYEKRSFNIVHCNTDLRDDELEIIIVRGINYSVPNPKEVDTYVKVEFPLLNEEFFRAKSNLAKDSNNPDYDQRFSMDIQRGNRAFQRIFKRQGVKFEVYSRGGFLRSDVLIGTVTVKLQPLETKCDIHDTFDLMEGRRAIGGKLEVKLRLRNPILTKQIEHINEKWLVLDS